MSHFLCLVVGSNVETQLARFHEFECTGHDDEYVQTIDETADALAEYERHAAEARKNGEPVESVVEWIEGWYGRKVVPYGEQPDLTDTHKYGYVTVDAKGNMVGCFDRTNPNKKWDWWVVGGRWTGLFKLKPGRTGERGQPGLMTKTAEVGTADSALKGDIDWDAMRDAAGERGARNYDYAMGILGGLPANKTWEEIRAEAGDGPDWDRVRNDYWNQPRCVAWKEAEKRVGYQNWPFGFSGTPDDFLISRERYIENERNSAVTTFAVVKDGQWFERGSMGWFGIAVDEKDTETWNSMYWKMISELPEDTLLTVCDLHI